MPGSSGAQAISCPGGVGAGSPAGAAAGSAVSVKKSRNAI